MVRSKWKNKLLYNKYSGKNMNKTGTLDDIIIFNPNFLILKEFVGQTFSVYEGNFYSDILITDDMVGFNLSKLLLTRYNNGSIHDKKKGKKGKK